MATNVPQTYTISELDKMSFAQLKDLAQTLGIVVSQTKTSRTKLMRQIRDCLVEGDQLNEENTVETEVELDSGNNENNDDVLGDNLEGLSLSDQLRLKIELAKIQSQERMELGKMKIQSEERVQIARLQARPEHRETSSHDLARYLQHVPEFQDAEPEEFFLVLENRANDFNFPQEKCQSYYVQR